MRKYCLTGTLLLVVAAIQFLHGQDFSNKGKDFWVGYGYHERMTAGGGGSQTMVLYFATEQATSVNVSIPGTGYSQTYSIPANTIFTSNPIPKTGTQDARLDDEGVSNKGIHITSDKPIVAYAHVYNQSVSGATLLFPTSTLGKEYYSINYTQLSNSSNANCWFYAVAVDPGVTTVEITPSETTLTHAAGVPFTVDLSQGQVINIMGTMSGQSGDLFRGVDLTGSKIRTISNGTEACKRIAVFSGSGRISLVCDGRGSGQKSSDNYMVQAFPKTAWGKNYLTVPTELLENNMYRIAVDDPSTVVTLNGTVLTNLVRGFYYEVGPINSASRIEADKPVMVAQYISTGRFCGNARSGDLGDPEVIYLSPVEQTINKVILNSTANYAITRHFINVTLPNSPGAINSFRLDGAPVSGFTTHPQHPGYVYLRMSVQSGQHVLQSDSGFNAVAYGYGDFESYGYNAGANVKDLYQYISVNNNDVTVDFPAACKSTPFVMSMTYPYQPTEISWQFNGLFPDVTQTSPVFSSSSVVNGRTLYKYILPGTFTVPVAGVYPIKIVARNPTADGCNGLQEKEYDLEVFEKPVADFNFATDGCVTNPVSFTDNSSNPGRTIAKWYWNFGDGQSVSDVNAASHTYSASGAYNVKYTLSTDMGCRSDTARKTVTLNNPPVARFNVASPYCAGQAVSFTDASTAPAGNTIAKWHWNFGDGSPVVIASSNAAQSHSFAGAGTYVVTLQVEAGSGCLSTVFNRSITVNVNPVVDFSIPTVCLPVGSAVFNSSSTISDGTESQLSYSWNFGDGSPAGSGKSPVHNYTGTGPYNVVLTVTSNNGCSAALTKSLSSIYDEPVAAFTALSAVCLGAAINFTDGSTAPGSSVTQWEWDFGDATSSNEKNPVKTYTAPGNYTVTLNVISAIGCRTVTKSATRAITVNALPVANFSSSLPGCIGQAISFTNTSQANAGAITSWNWNFGDNTNAVLNSGSVISHTYTSATTYSVSLQVETDRGCSSPVFTRQLVIHPSPTALFTAPVACINDNAVFTDGSGGGNITGWEWNFGDPNASAANPNTATIKNPTHQFTVPGQYSTQLIATSTEGCRDTIIQTFTVNGAVLTPSFSIENTQALCSNRELVIRDASRVDAGNIIRVEIFWDANDLSVRTVDNDPVAGKRYAHRYPEFGSPATKTYRVRYDVYSGVSCVNSFVQDVVLLATPVLAFDAALPVCSNAPAFPLTVQMLNILPGAGTFSGTGVSSSGVFNPGEAGAGAHSVVYTFLGTNGCSNTLTKTIIVDPTPVADAGADKVVLEGGKVLLTPTIVNNIPVQYEWTPATWLSNPGIAAAEASPPTDFTYTLKVTSDRGCSSTDEVFVKLLKNPVIPNIFSPNGDGIHDKWVIDYLESYPGCIVQIYNRYGQMIYKIVNYSSPWDGKINGKDAPIGTYYYIIDPRNGRKPITGFVDIIR